MVDKYGVGFANSVARYDFGLMGSFGGGNHKAGTKTKTTPSIFVHGWNWNSGAYEIMTATWLKKNHSLDVLYGNTYGSPLLPLGLGGISSFQWSLKCEYVKTVRNLIIAVAAYTNSTVNILAYSMGGPVSRKAILGGKCVDTGEDLGEPLTHLVENYLGVAGAMRGAMLCLADVGVCSHVDGMLCDSAFIKDINSKKRYEASNKIYVIQSATDEIVGYWACGTHPSQIDGADKTVTLFGYLHLGVIGLTGPLQYALVRTSRVELPKGEKFVIT